MALLQFSLFSRRAFFLLAFTLLHSAHVYGRETVSRHVVRVRSLLPSSACSQPKDQNPSILKVVHRHGPCSPLNPSRKPSHVKLLEQDQDRVKWIHHQTSAASNRDSARASLAATINAKSGSSLGTGNYIVQIGFGTPKKELSVVFDTGSDLTWIQCKPCSRTDCYSQQEPLFDRSQSSTYTTIPCRSSSCKQLGTYEDTCSLSKCRYRVLYGDNSQSKGFFGSDTLTLTPSDALSNFSFGCGDHNSGLFGKAAGLLGLGREPISLVSQSSSKYGRVFSYCLPSTSSSMGSLILGGSAWPNVQFTRMLTNSNQPSFYFLDLVAIKVGGQQLRISPTVFSNVGTLLDSGTVITRLPPSAYDVLQKRFDGLMTKYPKAPKFSILDTCYNFTGYKTVSVPTVELVFYDGATLNVDFTGILYVNQVWQACLAFAPNQNKNDVGIIGNTQQKRFNVVYDIPKKQIGFGAQGCR